MIVISPASVVRTAHVPWDLAKIRARAAGTALQKQNADFMRSSRCLHSQIKFDATFAENGDVLTRRGPHLVRHYRQHKEKIDAKSPQQH